MIRAAMFGLVAGVFFVTVTTAKAADPPAKVLSAEVAHDESYVMWNWVSYPGGTITWCGLLSSWQPAIDGWEAVLPGTQFTLQYPCSGTTDIESTGGQCPGGSGAVICVFYNKYFNVARNAYYLTGGEIRYDTDWYYSTAAAQTTAVSHELGHLMGLADRYMSDYSCNDSDNPAVMDALKNNGNGYITQGCDGNSAGPMSLDNGRALGFYNWQPPSNVTSSSTASHMYVSWWDRNWSEYDYPNAISRWDAVAGQWVLVQYVYYSQSIGWMDFSEPGDTWLDWVRPSNQPPGYYRDCIQVYTKVHGNQGLVCAPYRWLS